MSLYNIKLKCPLEKVDFLYLTLYFICSSHLHGARTCFLCIFSCDLGKHERDSTQPFVVAGDGISRASHRAQRKSHLLGECAIIFSILQLILIVQCICHLRFRRVFTASHII